MTGTVSVSRGSVQGGMNVLWRHLGLGLAGAVLTFAAGMLEGIFGWYQITGFLPLVITVGVSGWACQSVWSASLGPILRGPARWRVELTRIPFWFMAGGMGTVAGILIAKQHGMLDIREIPVKPLFFAGARAYTVIQIVVSVITGVLVKFR